MKHQYFGDVNDYLKYGLLRCIAEAGLNVGVCWMLTPQDTRADGGRLGYLSNAKEWRLHDPLLFDYLRKTLTGGNRHLSRIELNEIIPRARFFGELVPDHKSERVLWWQDALATLSGSDVLFFDPDNGIEIPSKPMGLKDSSKFVYWDEITKAWDAAPSLLVFQHFPRVKRIHYIPAIVRAMESRLKGSSVIPLKSSNVLFLLAHRADVELSRALQLAGARWSSRICTYDISAPPS